MKPLISTRKVVQAGNVVVLDEKHPHVRNNRDGTVIKLDVDNGVYTMDMWVCLDETRPARTVRGSSVTKKLGRPGTLCSSEREASCAEQELNGLEEGEDAMTDEEGERFDGEGEAGSGLASASTPKKRANCKREGRTRRNTRPIPRLVHTLHDG